MKRPLPKQLTLKHFNTSRRAATIELREKLISDGLLSNGAVAIPKASTVHDDERAAIDAFLAKGAPRRFPSSDSGDDFNLLVFLTSKGFKAFRQAGPLGALIHFSINGKKYNRETFVAFVDGVRAENNLPAIGRK